MPRDVNGTYTLPEAPFVPNTIIGSLPVNSDLSDIALALTQSLATTGVTTMSGPIRIIDGTITAPSLAFSQDTGVGFYRSGTNQFRWVVNSSVLATFNANNTVEWFGSHVWFGGGSNVIAGTLSSDTFFVTASLPNNSTYQGRPITAIDSGKSMIFNQAAAPTGWILRNINDFGIRVMSVGNNFGGSLSFSALFSIQSPSVTISDNLAHTHTVRFIAPATANLTPNFLAGNNNASNFFTHTMSNTGTSSLHTHGYDLRTFYLDFVAAVKE